MQALNTKGEPKFGSPFVQETPLMPIPILIDTDISLGTPNAEIDDGAALLLLAHSPQVRIEAVTAVHGNAPIDTAVTNLARFMGCLGLENVPIGRGAGRPLASDPGWRAFLEKWQAQYGPTPPLERPPGAVDAVDLIIETARACPGELVIVALGPLTNLALALQRYPPLTALVKAVYAMGGSLSETNQAEFNIRCDPEAAAQVLAADWTMWLHGLEITRRALFTPSEFEGLDSRHPAQALLKNQAAGWIRIVEAQGWETGGCSLHDAVAAAAVVAPGLFKYTGAVVEIETGFSEYRGVTRISTRDAESRVQVAAGIDAAAMHALILGKIME